MPSMLVRIPPYVFLCVHALTGIVPAHERTVTMGITNIVKSLGAAAGPLVTGYLAANQMFG